MRPFSSIIVSVILLAAGASPAAALPPQLVVFSDATPGPQNPELR